MTSLFVSFEGGEGSGKTTLVQALTRRLRQAGLPVQTFREPGSTPLGHKLRDILLYMPLAPLDHLTATTELLLFCAARAQFVERVLTPLIQAPERSIILVDRYADSTRAYQMFGRRLPWHDVSAAIAMSVRHMWPDLTFFLDIPPQQALARMTAHVNRLDAEALTFHEAVYRGYHEIIRHDTTVIPRSTRWRVIDAQRTADVVADEVYAQIIERWEGGA